MNDVSESLEKRIKQYYKQQDLPLDALVDLKQTIGQPLPKQAQSQPRPWRRVQPLMGPIGYLVAIAICIGIAAFILHTQMNNQRLTLVAAEIALNHADQFDTEFSTPNIVGLANLMPLLDFAPVHPARIQLNTYNIIGARYCTIDNAIAVQVRLEDSALHAYTLYEFKTPTSLQIADETVIDIGDIQVALWHEGDVTMGMAHRLQDAAQKRE